MDNKNIVIGASLTTLLILGIKHKKLRRDFSSLLEHQKRLLESHNNILDALVDERFNDIIEHFDI